MAVAVDTVNNRSRTRLLGALLVRLAQREGLQRMLDDLEDLPREELLEELAAEFEKIVGRRRVEQLVERDLERDLARERGIGLPEPPPAVVARAVTPVVAPAVTLVAPPPAPPVVTPVMTSPPDAPDLPVMKTPKHESSKHESRGRERQERPKKPAPRPDPPKERARTPEKERTRLPEIEASPQPELQHQRTVYELQEEGFFYLHGYVMLPAGEPSSEKPFMLEEKGIEGKDFAFALDHAGMRFFASPLKSYAQNVNRNGVLLLNKQESIRLRGIHASIMNELRAHGTLLPFAFGTVMHGRDRLLRRLDEAAGELRRAIEAQLKTTWWDLSVYALDSRIAEFLTPEGMSGRRERDRGRESYTIGPAGQKLDIKALEKILGKEKRLAEGIHEELSPIADRADVDMMVGFGSGSTDDWKLILRSSYELPLSRVQWFCRTLTELQYRHFIYELMLEFNGAQEPFTLTGS